MSKKKKKIERKIVGLVTKYIAVGKECVIRIGAVHVTALFGDLVVTNIQRNITGLVDVNNIRIGEILPSYIVTLKSTEEYKDRNIVENYIISDDNIASVIYIEKIEEENEDVVMSLEQ